MTNSIVLLAVLTLGQCYFPTTIDYCAPAEEQILKNTGSIYSRFYVTAAMPDGYRTQIPVINCKLPTVRQYTNSTGGRTLVLDYSQAKTYQQQSLVKYFYMKTTPTPAIRPTPAPIPDGTSRVPFEEIRRPESKPDPQPEAPQGEAPAPLPPTDERIEELLKSNKEIQERVTSLEAKISAMTIKPTEDIQEGETSPVSPKVTIEKVTTESVIVPPVPSLPEEVTPKNPADDISAPTYK